MTQKVYKFEPGQCVCLLGDLGAGSQKANVLKLSGTEMVLEATVPLRAEQFVYTTIKLADGPSLALSGLVVTAVSGGILVQWTHSNPLETDRIDALLNEYMKARPETAVAQPASSPVPPLPAAAELAFVGTVNRTKPHITRAPTPPAVELAAREAESSPGGATDLDAKLRKKSKTVRSADLASRVNTVQVVNMSTIRDLVKEAVDESIALHASSMSESDKKRLLEEAEASFAERLSLFKAEKSGLEVQINTLEESLQKAQALLNEERGKVLLASQFTVSDAGMMELEQRLGRLLEHALHTGKVGKELEDQLRAVVSRLLDDERDKIRDQAQQAQNDRINLLERKVQRLASSLECAESERDRARERAVALEASGGMSLHNVMKAGLDATDPQRNRKLGLLKEIFRLNQEIRQKLIEEGRLPRRAAVSDDGEPVRQPALSPEQVRVEEARIAEDLGIIRTLPVGSRSEDSSAPENEESPAAACVLVSGTDTDPDDTLWEPSGKLTLDSQPPKFKRLGSGQ